MTSLIYFARCGGDGPIKIGFTNTPLASRISFLQVGCPWPIDVVASVSGTRADERRLHAKFNASHMRGEWFNPTDDLIAFVASIADVVPVGVAAPKAADPMDIRAVRAELGMSQMAFADALGVHQTTVSAWEIDGPPKRAPAVKAILHLVAKHRSFAAAIRGGAQ